MTLTLSVVLPVPLGYAFVRQTMAHLRAQTIRERIELVLVTRAGGQAGIDREEPGAFGALRVVEAPVAALLTDFRVAGVRAASAPVVAFAEDHCFPAPDWAEALVRAHEGAWAAVGPAFENANPRTLLSWADLFLSFGAWIAPVAGGDVPSLPSHNTSYKRDALLACGARLPLLLEAEGMLQRELRARGLRLYLEPAARTRHVNFSRLVPFIAEHLVSGQLFGGRRAETQGWTWRHRAVYIVGGPLIPLVRLPRVIAEIRRAGRAGELLPRILPAVLLGLAAHSLGEMAGYAVGVGESGRRKSGAETDRARFVARDDLAVFGS